MGFKKSFVKRITSIMIIIALLLSLFPVQSFAKTAYDPKEDFKQLQLRFWEDQQPDVGFYINASSRYILETVKSPKMGSTYGEWSVMDLLRGMYSGYDYMNYIPEDYFTEYIKGIEGYVRGKQGELDRNKSTEWSRLILSLTALGYDITKVADKPGVYLKTYSPDNTGIINARQIEENNTVHINEVVKVYKSDKKYVDIPTGVYTADEAENTITDGNGTVYNLNTDQFMKIEEGYDFIEKFSKSYKFSYRQGINGPIWEIIALNTGGYKLYEDDSNNDANTVGKMLGYILSKEITQTDGTVGGWALSGKKPDPDITGMALQAMAPYYLDRSKFEAEEVIFNDKNYTYEEFAQAVERGIYVLSLIQLQNGGFDSWGTINAESITQVIVALTELGIDPLAENIQLKTIDKTIDFVTDGKEHEGVFTNNMIDALLTFWANGSGSAPEVGGFKHVTAGYDGGGGSGTGVNAMATDQALYGLIAYDRFKKGEKKLYDMTDMKDGQYKNMAAKTYTVTFDNNLLEGKDTESYSPYKVITMPVGVSFEGKTFASWNTKPDGKGVEYKKEELLSMPEHDITLYAQYEGVDSEAELNKKEAEKVIEKINKLPEIDKVTLKDKSSIEEARLVYNNLTEAQKVYVENYQQLVDLEAKLEELASGPSDSEEDQLAADGVISLIKKLPGIESITLDDEEEVQNANSAYEALTSAQKKLVINYQDLVALEAKLKELSASKPEALINSTGEIKQNIQLRPTGPDAITYGPTKGTLILNGNLEIKGDASNQITLRNVIVNGKLVVDTPKASVTLDSGVVINGLTSIKDVAGHTFTNHGVLKDIELTDNDTSRFINKGTMETLIVDGRGTVTLGGGLSSVVINDADGINVEKSANIAKLTVNKELDISLSDGSTIIHLEAEVPVVADGEGAIEIITGKEAGKVKGTVSSLSDAISKGKKVEEIINQIKKLPEADKLTLEDQAELKKAENDFEELSVNQKAIVSQTDKDKLQALKIKMSALTASETDIKAAKAVIEQINNLPELNNLIATHKTAVQAARDAFSKLTVIQQNLVTNQAKLISLEAKMAELLQLEIDKAAAEKVNNSISNLPDVAYVTLDNKEAVEKVRLAYRSLTATQQKLVSNIGKLAILEARITELEKIEADQATVGKVISLINSLPRESDITSGNKTAIEKARQAYTDLTTAQQKMVSNYDELLALEEKLAKVMIEEENQIASEAVIEEISNLPSVKELKLENKPAVEKARQAYKELTQVQRKLVNNYDELVALETRLEELTEADTIQNNEVNTKASANDNASFDSNGNDSNPNSYPTVKQSSQSNQGEQIKSGSVLPNTSTNYFNMLVIGFVFMVVGGVFYLYFRKKAIN